MDRSFYFRHYFDLGFISIEFWAMLALVFGALYFWRSNLKKQNIVLLLASYAVYAAWNPRFLVLLFFITSIDFVVGQKIHESDDAAVRKRYLVFALLSSIGTLFLFRYHDFFLSSLVDSFGLFGLEWKIRGLRLLVPLGLTFFVLRSMSYVIDIYRKKMEPTESFINYALFVSFFPQLLAGPIEKARNFLPQIESERSVNRDDIAFGFYLVIWGLFKKVVVADNLAPVVEYFYGRFEVVDGFDVFIGTFAFAVQIFADFSGYCDIARGICIWLGFKVSKNFNLPFFATNVVDYWKRWHITFSEWLKDYLYLPLGGNEVGGFKKVWNVFIVMLLGAMWYGTGYNFLIWGFFHAVLLLLTRAVQGTGPSKILDKIPNVLKIVFTFLIVLYGWMLFRAESPAQILSFTGAIFDGFEIDRINLGYFAITLFYSLMIIIPQLFQYFSGDSNIVYRNFYVRTVFIGLLVLGFFILSNDSPNEFIFYPQ